VQPSGVAPPRRKATVAPRPFRPLADGRQRGSSRNALKPEHRHARPRHEQHHRKQCRQSWQFGFARPDLQAQAELLARNTRAVVDYMLMSQEVV
jgi:hypothetical protein